MEEDMIPTVVPPPKPEPIPPARKDKRAIITVAATVAVIVLAVGGVCGYRAYVDHKVTVAREACQSAVAGFESTSTAYKRLLAADDTVAALKTDVKSVKDTKTVDTLKRAAAVKLPSLVKCDASKAAGLDAATAKAGKASKTVKTDTKALESAVKAVEASKLDKTVDDANNLYESTDGKVQDDKTRETLAKAIKSRDVEAIGKAVKAVNDSKAAKEKADAEAKAKVEQEAAAQAAAAAAQQQAQQQSQRSYSSGSSNGSYSNRWAGSTGGQSYSGGGSQSSGSQGGSSSNTGSSSSSDNIHYDWEDNTGDQYNCQPGKFCPIG